MKIDLLNWGLEERSHQVFYISSKYVLYKQGQYIVFADCSGEVLSETLCPFDSMSYSVVNYPDCIVLLVGGRDFIVFDKNGFKVLRHQLSVSKHGRVVTDIYRSGENTIIFGTVVRDRSQLLIYDFENGSLVSQSPSWKTNQIDRLVVRGSKAYALLSRSFFVICDLFAGENFSKQFESGVAESHFVFADDSLCYVSEGCLRILKDGKTRNIPVRGAEVSNVCGVSGDKAYLVHSKSTSLCCLDLTTGETDWNLDGGKKIRDFVMVHGLSSAGEVNALVARTAESLFAVDLAAGRAMKHHQVYGSYKLHATDDHVIVNCAGDISLVIPGVK